MRNQSPSNGTLCVDIILEACSPGGGDKKNRLILIAPVSINGSMQEALVKR